MHTQLGSWSVTLVLVVLLGTGSCGNIGDPPEPSGVENGTPTESASATLPPDGRPLYEFLMREEPELMAEILCVCCDAPLAACYQGLCPYS
jgi:hypothetical protein